MTDKPAKPKRAEFAGDSAGELAFLAAMSAWNRERGRAALIDEAEPWRPPGHEAPASPPPEEDAGEESAEADPRALKHDHVQILRLYGRKLRLVPVSLPPECPIAPLGRLGRVFYYLSPGGELIALTDAEHGQAHIAALWAPRLDELNRAFPQFNAQGSFVGFRANYARDAMMGACAVKGPFEAHERVRGRGCWKGEAGELIQHLGDRILVGEAEEKPGEIAGFVYPGRPALPAPARGGKAAVGEIYARFGLWNWERGELDARLLLGQLAAAVLGGALAWRPMAFLCGDAGTGKSTLQQLLRGLLPGRLLATVDASEAALRGLLGQDALAVSFDEIEADATNDKAQQVMKLARASASGDNAFRSSASQEVRQFTLRGSFIFSAIIPPSMRQQDGQRFAFLRLQPLPPGARLEPLTPAREAELGAGLVGRITEAWPRWARTLQAFELGLAREGHERRGCAQFGALLAAAHLVLEDGDPSEADVGFWCAQLRRSGLAEYDNAEPAWLQAWRHLLSAQPDAWRSDGSPTVAERVRQALSVAAIDEAGEDLLNLRNKLERAGLALVRQRGTQRWFLAVPPRHQAIAQIYAGTDFQRRGGEGAWFAPMRGAPKLEGDEGGLSGVLRIEKVPRLNRQKCCLFWLDGAAVINGERVPIFERRAAVDTLEEIGEREPGEDG